MERYVCEPVRFLVYFWLSATGGQGAPPKTTFAPLKFSKNNRKNNRNNILLFRKTMVYCLLPPLNFFLAESQTFRYHPNFGPILDQFAGFFPYPYVNATSLPTGVLERTSMQSHPWPCERGLLRCIKFASGQLNKFTSV